MTRPWTDNDTASRPRSGSAGCDGEVIETMPVPVGEPPRTRYTDRLVRPSSNFVAQLIAIDGGYSQARETVGAEPRQASAAYRSYGLQRAAGRTQRMS